MLMALAPVMIRTFLLIGICLAICPVLANAADKQILIISNAGDGPYPKVIEGFKKQLAGQAPVRYAELLLAQVKADSSVLSNEITQHKPDLIFAVGAEAAQMVRQNAAAIPMVVTLVLKDELFNTTTTGVSLTYPLTTQIQWLKRFFPNQLKVAVLFNPEENNQNVAALKKVAEHNGLELIAIPVQSPRQLPDALEQLAKNIEVLFSIPDDVVMSPKTAKEVLLASFRNRVPLIGLSENWVKSGALYALSWDYDDLGQQCAMQTQKILSGQSILQVIPETPRKLTYTVNTKITEHMNIEISDDLLKNAKILFE